MNNLSSLGELTKDANFEQIIGRAYCEIAKHHKNANITGIVDWFACDAVYYRLSSAPAKGAEEIERELEQFHAVAHDVTCRIEVIECKCLYDIGFDVSSYTLSYTMNGTRMVENGHHIVVWRLTEKGWRIAHDMYSIGKLESLAKNEDK